MKFAGSKITCYTVDIWHMYIILATQLHVIPIDKDFNVIHQLQLVILQIDQSYSTVIIVV